MKIGLLPLAAMLTAMPVQAQVTTSIYVSSEKEDQDMRKCGISYDALTAAVKGTLRYNRIPIATEQDYFGDRANNLYVNVTAFPIDETNCAAALAIKLENHTKVMDPVAGQERWADIVYCDKTQLLNWNRYKIEDELIGSAKQFTEQCLADYYK